MIALLLLLAGMFPGIRNAEAASEDNGQEIINKVVDNFKLLALTQQTYKKLHGTDIKVVAVHAGLECGTFAKLNPKLDMISIGPDLKDVQSPKETLYLNSIPRIWNLLQELLLQLY